MDVFERQFVVRAPLAVVREFHGDSSALRALTPPPMILRLHRFGEMAEGMEAEFTLWLGPIPIHWVARHEDVSETGFVDVQLQGPMKTWRHRHRFVELEAGTTKVEDRIEYEHPSGLRGFATRLLFSKPALHMLFLFRSLSTQRRCESVHRAAHRDTP